MAWRGEVEDGMGWCGLVASKSEQREKAMLLRCANELEAAPKQQAVGVAEAWQEGYRQGVLDERTSEANIGIAGFGAKVEPARNNPYAFAAPKQQAVEVTEEMVERAMTAYNASRGTYADEVPTDRDDIRIALLAAQQQATPKGEGCASCGDLADFLDEDGLCASCWCAQEPLEAPAALPGKTEDTP